MGPQATRRLLRAIDSGRTKVGAAEDVAEREADRQAAGLPQRRATRIPRWADGGVLAETHGAGRPLEDSTRRAMETRLGADLSGIRVHDDEAAAASADALRTRAFTDGAHVAFGRGQYQPGQQPGQSLLAHELSHIVGGHAASGVLRRGGPADPSGGKPRSGGLTKAEWAKIRNARKYFNLPPTPTKGVTTIVGILIDPSGHEYPLKSGHEGGPYGGTQRGNIPRGKGEGFSSGAPSETNIGTHIEGHAAAKMHELGLTEATLLSEEQPCKVCDISQGWDPETGDWTAEAAKKPGVATINTVLPPGSKLTIVDPEATGTYTSYRLGPPVPPPTPHPAALPQTKAAAPPPMEPEGKGGVVVPGGAASSEATTQTVTGGTAAQPGTRSAEPPVEAKAANATSRSEPTARVGSPIEPVFEGGPSARGEAVGGAVQLAAELKDWIMGKLGDWIMGKLGWAQSQRVNAILKRKLDSFRITQRDHPELGAFVTIYWRKYSGNEGEESLAFEDMSIKTGTNEREAREAPETSQLDLSAPLERMETQEMWFPPEEPLSVAEYHTPYRRIAIATFAGRAVLQDVSWGGRWGGKFNKKGTTKLSVPEGMHPVFAILMPPTSVYVPGDGQMDIDTASDTAAEGYQVPVISDLHAAMVFPHDLETLKLFARSPRIKDYTWQLRGDFDLLRWVPIENVQIVSAFTGDVTRPIPAEDLPADFRQHIRIIHGEVASIRADLTSIRKDAKSNALDNVIDHLLFTAQLTADYTNSTYHFLNDRGRFLITRQAVKDSLTTLGSLFSESPSGQPRRQVLGRLWVVKYQLDALDSAWPMVAGRPGQ
jgi:Domain of unknown function (DUF4157)